MEPSATRASSPREASYENSGGETQRFAEASLNGGLRPLALPGHGPWVGRQVVDRGGEVLDQVVHDPLGRQDADRPAGLVEHRQVAVAAFLHAGRGEADRVLAAHAD